jgi:beta-phosphoglucomutase-like phosphatase (HAD superfamily)
VPAARAAGFDFLGISCDGDADRLKAAGAAKVLADFRAMDRFLSLVGLT